MRELNVNARTFASGDAAPLQAPDVEPEPLARLAAQKGGTMTTSDVWAMASAAIDDSAQDATLIPRLDETRISLTASGILWTAYVRRVDVDPDRIRI